MVGIRIIDANFIVKVAEHAWDEWNLAMATQDTNRGVNKVLRRQELCKAVKAVADDAPTIDPETLPVVLDLRKQLEQVTAERDAAVRDIERALAHGPGYNICMLCKKTQGSIQCKSTLCLPEWRGPVAENTASESEAKNHAAD